MYCTTGSPCTAYILLLYLSVSMEEATSSPIEHSPSVEPVSIQNTPPRLSLHPIYTTLTLIMGIFIGVGGLFAYQEFAASPEITSYEMCIKAKGSVIQESYPATCITKDGKRFIQPVDITETNPIYFDPLSCTTDSDCTIGIQSDGCCLCPRAINVREIGKDGWKEYASSEKNQSTSSKDCKTFAACAPCEKPSSPTCQNNQCVFQQTDNQQTKAKQCLSDRTVCKSGTCMANPSATFCICMGGTYTTIENENGQNGICTINNTQIDGWTYYRSFAPTPTPQTSTFTCPTSEWVNCMPGPDAAGIKLECTDTFLTWAKTNCPNFQGAAL